MSNKRPYIILATFFLTVLAVPIGVIWPSVRTITKTADAIYLEYEFLEEKSQRGQDIRQAKGDFEQLRLALPQLRTVALEPGAELQFITTVEELANAHGVDQTIDLRVEAAKKNPGYQAIPFALNVRGNYADAMQYLMELRTLPLSTAFQKITLSRLLATDRGAPTDSEGRIQMHISGEVFQHLEPSALLKTSATMNAGQ